MKSICVLTGTRAEYGLLKPVMDAINKHPKLELKVIATGMHLDQEYGNSVNEIIKDGFKIDARVPMNPGGDEERLIAKSIGVGIDGIADALHTISPDWLLLLGDRTEALAGAIAAAYMNIPIAHIHGGDSAKAGLDESTRHSITKFSHIHFAATKKSASRIYKMGEDKSRIFIVGAPAIDTIKNAPLMSKKALSKKLGISSKSPLIVMIQHSVSTEPEKAESQAIETLEALKNLKYQTVIIYPNNDAGGKKIILQIMKYSSLPFFHIFRNLSHIEYLSLLSHADMMVGNSSSGIIESSYFKIPVINIGTRQYGRECSENIIDVEHDRVKIQKAIHKALSNSSVKRKVIECKSPYGNGNTGNTIAQVLAKTVITDELMQKKLRY